MRPLHQRGHRETKKQALRRALRMERAGLEEEEGGASGNGALLQRRGDGEVGQGVGVLGCF